jgi:hypothetical protein
MLLGELRPFLDHFTTEDVSLEEAKIQATSILRNVKFEGRLANLCVIRDLNQGVLAQVRVSVQDRLRGGSFPPARTTDEETPSILEKARSK